MRKVLSKSLLTAVATTGALAGAAGYAQADAGAGGSAAGSPGVGSGNVVQAPVHVPANVCGNTIDVIALLNPAFGNTCVNDAPSPKQPHHPQKPKEEPKKPPQRTEQRTEEKSAASAPERPDEPAEKKLADPKEKPAETRVHEGGKAMTPVDPAGEAAPPAPRAAEHGSAAADVLAQTGGSGAWGTAALGVGTLLGGVVLYRRATRRHV
ncbi:chaplin [Streptomyces albus subsp. chlorinus]|uniref:chaplin n=1 Tax=Streptomyces albus TaxID=1888 RepID=UPI00156D44E2|nr:chaplin [Streptomyces albus]NSC23903.1 chaplin [Streptomyces albus subsp. chlorinus]